MNWNVFSGRRKSLVVRVASMAWILLIAMTWNTAVEAEATVACGTGAFLTCSTEEACGEVQGNSCWYEGCQGTVECLENCQDGFEMATVCLFD